MSIYVKKIKKHGKLPYYIVQRYDGASLMEFRVYDHDSNWSKYFSYDKKDAKALCKAIQKGHVPLGRKHDYVFGRISFWGFLQTS